MTTRSFPHRRTRWALPAAFGVILAGGMLGAACAGIGDDTVGAQSGGCPKGGNEGLFGGWKQGRGEGDAPVCAADDTGAYVVNFPDGFPNVATKCGAPGIRIFVPRDTDASDRPAVTAIADPNCQAAQ